MKSSCTFDQLRRQTQCWLFCLCFVRKAFLFNIWQLKQAAACAVVSHVSLAAELDLLLHLLALPSAVVCAATVPSGTQPMFASGSVAALYAATVLCSSGELLSLLHASPKQHLHDMFWVYLAGRHVIPKPTDAYMSVCDCDAAMHLCCQNSICSGACCLESCAHGSACRLPAWGKSW